MWEGQCPIVIRYEGGCAGDRERSCAHSSHKRFDAVLDILLAGFGEQILQEYHVAGRKIYAASRHRLGGCGLRWQQWMHWPQCLQVLGFMWDAVVAAANR